MHQRVFCQPGSFPTVQNSAANNQAIANTGSINWYFTKYMYTQRAANVGGGKNNVDEKRGGGGRKHD